MKYLKTGHKCDHGDKTSKKLNTSFLFNHTAASLQLVHTADKIFQAGHFYGSVSDITITKFGNSSYLLLANEQ